MAITLKHPRPVTDEEILELSRLNPEYQIERTATGALVVTPTSGRSGQREHELALQLGAWAKRDGGGVGFSPTTGFVLPDGAFVIPDAAWLRRERWETLPLDARDEILHLCPDAAFEIRSKSSRPADLREKMRAYLANGAGIAVLIDPYERTVEVYRPGQEAQVFPDPGRGPETRRNPATVALDPELPGFVLDLGPLFEA